MNSKNDAQHDRFCREYVIDLSGKDAAIRAGYSAKTAPQIASRLLKQPHIKARIAELQSAVAEKLEITQERVLAEIARIAFANTGDYVAWDEEGVTLKSSATMTREQLAVVSEVAEGKEGVRFKLHSKVDALDKLGRHLGLFKEKVEITGKDGGPIETADVTDPKDVARRLAFILERGKAAAKAQSKTD